MASVFGLGSVVKGISDAKDEHEKRESNKEDRKLRRKVTEQGLEARTYGLERSKVEAAQKDEQYDHKKSRRSKDDEYQDYQRSNQKKKDSASLKQSAATLQHTNLANRKSFLGMQDAAKKAKLKEAVELVLTGNLREAANHINNRMKANIDPNSVTFDQKTGVLGFQTKDGKTGAIYIRQLATMAGIKIGKQADTGKYIVNGSVIYHTKKGNPRKIKGMDKKKGFGVTGNVIYNKDTGTTKIIEGAGKSGGKKSSHVQVAEYLRKGNPELSRKQALILAKTTITDPTKGVLNLYKEIKKLESVKSTKKRLSDDAILKRATSIVEKVRKQFINPEEKKSKTKVPAPKNSKPGKYSHLWK